MNWDLGLHGLQDVGSVAFGVWYPSCPWPLTGSVPLDQRILGHPNDCVLGQDPKDAPA